MPGRVEECEIATRRVREHVHPVETEALAERLHVGDLPVDAKGRRIGGDGGVTRTPRIECDQPAPARQPAEIAEAGAGTHRAAGQHEQRLSLAPEVVGEFGSVGRGEGGHGAILMTGRPEPAIGLRGPRARPSRSGGRQFA